MFWGENALFCLHSNTLILARACLDALSIWGAMAKVSHSGGHSVRAVLTLSLLQLILLIL